MASTTISYSSSGYNGLMDWLGKDKGTTTFANPASSRGHVDVAVQSQYSSGYAGDFVFQQDANAPWHSGATTEASGRAQELRFDFLDGRIVPSHFAMQARSSPDDLPSEFRLIASADGVTWDELLHESGLTTAGGGAWHDFEIVGADAGGYRFFHFLIPHDDTSLGGNEWHSVGEIEIYGSYSDGHSAVDPPAVACPFFQAGFSGLADWQGRGDSFQGSFAEGAGFSAVEASSELHVLSYHRYKALDHNGDSYFSSTNAADSWWRVDVGSGNQWYVTHIAFYGAVSSNPRNFKWQGSNDDTTSPTNWTDLDTVVADGPADNEWFVSALASPAAYRHFRILSTGQDDTANDYLRMAEVEFYGTSDGSVPGGGGGTGSYEYGDSLLKYLQDQGATSKEIVGALNELNATSGVEFQKAYDTYFSS